MEQGRWVRGGFAAATALLTLALAPATASAGLMAAYERYEPGKGFEIGLVNVATGAAIYLLTYRTLKGQRLLTTSGSIAFRVTRSGDFRNARRQR